jgi:hypothetical protein
MAHRPWNKWSWIALVLGALMMGALAQYAFVEGDTVSLLNDTDGILQCLRKGVRPCTNGGKFPPLQLLLTVPMRSVGLSADAIGTFLARVSLGAYLGLLGVTWRVLRPRSRSVGTMAILVLTSGLLIHYATRSFVEMAAAFLTVSFVAGWLQGKTFIVGTAGFFAALSKETAFPFLILLAVVCALARCPRGATATEIWRREWRRFAASVSAIGLGVLLSIGLNLFRFGKPYNLAYLGEAGLGPPLRTQVRLFAALWLAPNAGLLFFWPLFVAVLASVPFVVQRYSSAKQTGALRPYWGLVVLLVLVTGLCARWWAPFGWWAWGQRLMIPWLPAILSLLGFAYAPELKAMISHLVSTRLRAIGLTAAVAILALPHVCSIFRSEELIAQAFAKYVSCPPGSYYDCLEAAAWTDPSPLLHAYRLLLHPFVRLRVLLYCGLLALGGAALYQSTRSLAPRVDES